MGFPGGSVVKNPPANAGNTETQVQSLGPKIPWSRKWQPTLVFVPGKFHGQKSLVCYHPWGCKELDTTEWLSMHACTSSHDPLA